LIALIPYVFFALGNPGALTSRFQDISYIYETIPLTEKIMLFFNNYSANWSLNFLIFRGDGNLRHSTGVGGMVFITVFILFLVSITGTLLGKKWDRFTALLFVNLLFTPIASALTSEGNPHAIRALPMGYYIILFSCYGLKSLSLIQFKPLAIVLIGCVYISIGYEVTKYQIDYFIHYPARSVDAMGSFDFKSMLDFAIEKSPTEIIFFDNFPGGLDNFLFYSRIVDNPENIPIRASKNPIPQTDTCIIYRRQSGAEEELDKYSLSYKEIGSKFRPSDLEKRFEAKTFFGVMKSRCYQP
jgi:hypothetical protein